MIRSTPLGYSRQKQISSPVQLVPLTDVTLRADGHPNPPAGGGVGGGLPYVVHHVCMTIRCTCRMMSVSPITRLLWDTWSAGVGCRLLGSHGTPTTSLTTQLTWESDHSLRQGLRAWKNKMTMHTGRRCGLHLCNHTRWIPWLIRVSTMPFGHIHFEGHPYDHHHKTCSS